jgi:Lipopolysaccharide-assembly
MKEFQKNNAKLKPLIRIFLFLFFSFFIICQTSCMHLPGHSDVRGERFGNETLSVKQIYIQAAMDAKFSKSFGEPLTESLKREFQQQGIRATVDIQPALTPDGAVDYQRIAPFSPDAILLIRLGETHSYISSSSYSSGQLSLSVTFDLLDAKEKGIWRGRVQVYRLDEMGKTAESIGTKVVSDLIGNRALTLKGSK